MRICMTGNSFPMSKDMAYGGERIVYYLIQELAKRHEVYVVSREGSNFDGIPIVDYVPVGSLTNEIDVHFEAAKALGIDFDIFQSNYFGEGWTRESQERWPYCELTWCAWCHAFWQLKEVPFNVISYSKSLQNDFSRLGIPTSMIYYGLPKDLYTFSPNHDGYAVWIGKIEGGKAPGLAIQLARAAGLKIVVMGPPYNTGCFYDQVAPYIDNENVFWLRGVNDKIKQEVMSRAKVFIYSNDNTWREHFGIVMAEALAMGTPILGFNRINQDCSIVIDKIVEDGVHGYILHYNDSNNVQEILDKGVPLLQKIDQIDRMECRKWFEKRFTAELMASRYEWLYNEIVTGKKFGVAEIPI